LLNLHLLSGNGIRFNANKQATKISTQISQKIAIDVAEKVANEYIQKNFLKILESYNFTNSNNFNVEELQEDKNGTK